MKPRRIAATSALAILHFTSAVLGNEDPRNSQREWQVYNGDLKGTKYSELDQINRGNVDQLELVWRYRADDKGETLRSTIQCNPIVVDGVMYLTTPGQKAVAINALIGEEIWRFDPHDGDKVLGYSRGLLYWEDGPDKRIYVGASDYYYALNAATGEPIKSFGVEGRLDMREQLDTDGILRSYSPRAPGVVYKDILIIGGSVGEGPAQAAPGHIRGFDIRTGERKWIFHTIPHPGEYGYETWSPDSYKRNGGANAWSGLTLDSERGIVFAATGAPSYDGYGGDRVGDNLFANCVLALYAETGERIWHFQITHHDIWDYDLPMPPVLVTVEKDGRQIDAVAQATKIALLFVFDRETGEPIFEVEERPVPQSEIWGEETSRTQPFPTKPLPYGRIGFDLEDVTDLTPESRAFVLDLLKDFKYGPLYKPPGFEKTILMPQFNGGSEWPGPGFDPETNILYINVSNEAEYTSMKKATEKEEMPLWELGEDIYQGICSNCHGLDDAGKIPGMELPALRTVKERLSREEVYQVIQEGRGSMPSFAPFHEIEKQSILAFLFRDRDEEKIKTSEVALTWRNNIPYVMNGHKDLHDQEGYPINKRPWGQLHAIDLNTGDFVWSKTLGTYPALEAKGVEDTGTFNIGGPMVTAGGLVFIGATKDERFRAFDKATGEILWTYQLDAAGYATPATFEMDGRQYVVIAGGGGSKLQTKPGDSYYCFALP
ncbi:PQQ-binding-like beta-propeller repeat protein [Opitutia bacterium ISCC 51]|nr:PQQ-binding-like beta-propeller repeat protein [Opitutae bacterium ISCC 51]QXD27514.1 PQQ-binding-like beta-propeller repeat protein [Opitutae bacterium ISCC 52]